ncbi:MAG: tRNA(Ile)-lysidine synthase [Gemmatimonadetes bacterium]|nr:tRNA(Ile)-lysidine synthase [Gemmatimonadota bacterium]
MAEHERVLVQDTVRTVELAVGDALERAGRVVLAVSGGLDSMVLLAVAARVARDRVAGVATFDHGTGAHARRAAAHVAESSATLGFPCWSGGATALPESEEGWRAARWEFLHGVARQASATIATAHTLDDQLETVLHRVLRGSGTRGLAGLLASGGPVRPLLGMRRAMVAQVARALGVAHLEDPSNGSLRFFRNRIRHEILPALRSADAAIDERLLGVARRAAGWRAEVEALAGSMGVSDSKGGDLCVATREMTGYSREALGVLWPALAARGGAVLDRRGTVRLTEFTIKGRPGQCIQLSGGWEVRREREGFALRRSSAVRRSNAAPAP